MLRRRRPLVLGQALAQVLKAGVCLLPGTAAPGNLQGSGCNPAACGDNGDQRGSSFHVTAHQLPRLYYMAKRHFRTWRTFAALSEALLVLGFVSVALVSLLYLVGVSQIPGSSDKAVQVPAPSLLAITADHRLVLVTESVVEVKLISVSTAFNDEVGLRLGDNWGREIFSCQGVSPGFYDDLGTLPAGELTLMLTTPERFTYFTGPGSRNPDDLVHARLQSLSASTVTVGWEDSFGGGDQDFDDCVVEVSAVAAETRITSVEEKARG